MLGTLLALPFVDRLARKSPRDYAVLAGWEPAATTTAPPWRAIAGTPVDPDASCIEDRGSTIFDTALTSPVFVVPDTGLLLRLQQRFDLSWANTAGVLEIAIDHDAWADFLDAGGRFLEGGYQADAFAGNPIGARPAWGGSRTAFMTLAALPERARGKRVRLRFRLGSSGTGDAQRGWCLAGLHLEIPGIVDKH